MANSYTFLPMPREVETLPGTCPLQPERLIWLAEDTAASSLFTGRAIQEALATVGPRWELTAARGSDSLRLGAMVHVNPALVPQAQGYHLTILPRQVRIEAHDAAGAFYAAMTLRQLARQCAGTGELPCLRISDWPDFEQRGVMLDISRDKVPTLDTLRDLIEMLAEWKINQFQLYTEHTFAYRNHREVWREASPLTGEEILELDRFCRERMIELVPNQNSFGHMDRWLKHPRYTPLAESTSAIETDFGPVSRFCLCPLDPRSLELLDELYDELLPHFASRQFNVGCDETFDLGRGRSKAACEARGTERVYLDFLHHIHDLVERRGRTMQFWGDIIIKQPELISELPPNIIALEWGYEASHPFAEDCAKFGAAGVPFYVCPGTSSWNSLTGRTANAIANLRSAAEHGLANGAIGYLNTDWGDNGHWQPLPVSYLGYAYGAGLAWAGSVNRDLDLPRALDLHAFHDAAGVMGQLVYDLGNTYKMQTAAPVHNNSLLNEILLPRPKLRERMLDLTIEGLGRADQWLDQVIGRITESRMTRPDAYLITEELRNATALSRHACGLGMAMLEEDAQEAAQLSRATKDRLARELEMAVVELRGQWVQRNRPGGLNDSAGRLEKLIETYKAI